MSVDPSSLVELQRLIDRAAKANAAAHKADRALCEECLRRYGKEPGEVDADGIIDAVFGGCGESFGMSASDFDAEMRKLCGCGYGGAP